MPKKSKILETVLGLVSLVAVGLFLLALYYVLNDYVSQNATQILIISGGIILVLVLVGSLSLQKLIKRAFNRVFN